MQALYEKYPTVGIEKAEIYYSNEKKRVILQMYVNHYPHTFCLDDKDLEDIPKLLDGIDYLTRSHT
jgi:hypothetical protein